jgi:hypothetical protein
MKRMIGVTIGTALIATGCVLFYLLAIAEPGAQPLISILTGALTGGGFAILVLSIWKTRFID